MKKFQITHLKKKSNKNQKVISKIYKLIIIILPIKLKLIINNNFQILAKIKWNQNNKIHKIKMKFKIIIKLT